MMEMLISLVWSLCYAHTDQNTALCCICIKLLPMKNRVNLWKCIAISLIKIPFLYKLCHWTSVECGLLRFWEHISMHHNSVSLSFSEHLDRFNCYVISVKIIIIWQSLKNFIVEVITLKECPSLLPSSTFCFFPHCNNPWPNLLKRGRLSGRS